MDDLKIKMASVEWYEKVYKNQCTILDFDGWHRDPNRWEHSWFIEQVTHEEFTKRLCQSTIIWKTGKL